MTYLARRLEERGARVSLVSPAHLQWRGAGASVEAEWTAGPVDAVVRFFPAEWLPNLPSASRWAAFFHGRAAALSNPATAVLTQSKRFPLVWSALRTAMPTWRALLPETRDPREASWGSDDGWVVKPALGRVGEGVGLPGIVTRQEWERIARAVRRNPSQWVAQRRFAPTTLSAGDAQLHPCVGVYTIDGRAAGAYGRLASRPLIDASARDAAVLVALEPTPVSRVGCGIEREVASAV
jgi:glutathionylspermidine synthase